MQFNLLVDMMNENVVLWLFCLLCDLLCFVPFVDEALSRADDEQALTHDQCKCFSYLFRLLT